MVAVETLVAFVPAALALILAPGPDTVYVLSRGVGDGRATGFRAACGVATGVLVHTAVVVLGLAALLRTVPTAYLVVKYLGAAYLLVLGVRALTGGDDGGFGAATDATDSTDTSGATDSTATGGYGRGLLVNVLNPKVALFFLAFLPQFVPSGDPVGLAALGGTYALLTVVYLGVVAVGADSVADRLVGHERALERASGVVLVAFGLLTLSEDALGGSSTPPN
ncbi:LysE family translocator [Halomarina rubra]|uniref:LysE family translocator n=1 Tax=Halomarina rubra TaxID=2071873 RepID=A0ABD6AVN8_9EURY|nr:LysE family translocator [Halomarina rubra]